MKLFKKVCIASACLLLLLLAGCGRRSAEAGKIYQVYYLDRSETRVDAVEYRTETQDVRTLLKELLEQLEKQPEDVMQKAPLSMGFSVLSWEIREKQLLLRVDDKYRDLLPTTEVLVRAAIVQTLTQIEGIDFVTMQIREEPLLDSLGNAVGSMSADTFINNAGNEINAYESTQLTLYFANEAGNGLVETNRWLEAYSTNISAEKLVVEQLIAGPETGKGAGATVNPSTKIISVNVKDGVCYVNLDSGFLTPVSNVTADVTVYSIVNSLVELSNVNKVQISVNGETNLTFRDKYDLSTVFERNLEIMDAGE